MATFQPRQSFLPLRSFVARGGAPELYRERVSVRGATAENTRGEYVLYWMQSSRRIPGNLALNWAVEFANQHRIPVVVYESLRPDYRSANDRIHTFVLEGVERNRTDAEERGLRYHFFLPRTAGEARGALRKLALRARVVVTDEFPTFIVQEQTERFAARAELPVITIDGNGILPMRALEKERYGAKFFRDFAHRHFEQYWGSVVDPEPLVAAFNGDLGLAEWDGSDVAKAVASCEIDHGIATVRRRGGREAALATLETFLAERLDGYSEKSSSEANASSELSPYLHFGFVDIHEVAQRVLLSEARKEDIDAFLEQAVVRRELSFNLCHFRRDHDSLEALPDWARRTLDAHRDDRRSPSYSCDVLERGETADEVWNLSQRALLRLGTIHNYLRMLWGKKLIEWCETPEEAHRFMIEMHERYAIDGRDPNTHAGVLWCFGKHDRPWSERAIFGTVRYMSSDSTRKKVDLAAYARKVEEES